MAVTVLSDWTMCHRGQFWKQCLESTKVPHTLRLHSLAEQHLAWTDRVHPEPGTLFLEILGRTSVLVLNWDSVNGDPDFGSDLALRWFTHRRLEVLAWVRAGGIMVIEGQATFSVPVQSAYDAILGPSEVRVSGPESRFNPDLQHRRCGSQGRLTVRAHNSPLFSEVSALINRKSRPVTEMFPDPAYRVVGEVAGQSWEHLYRGWFRRTQLRQERLQWVTLARTVGRLSFVRCQLNQTILRVAKLNRGAIFVSTMNLASSEQSTLVRAMLLSHGRTDQLPGGGEGAGRARRFAVSVVVPIVAAIAAIRIAAVIAGHNREVITSVSRVVLTPLGVLAVSVIVAALGWLRKLVREFRGM